MPFGIYRGRCRNPGDPSTQFRGYWRESRPSADPAQLAPPLSRGENSRLSFAAENARRLRHPTAAEAWPMLRIVSWIGKGKRRRLRGLEGVFSLRATGPTLQNAAALAGTLVLRKASTSSRRDMARAPTLVQHRAAQALAKIPTRWRSHPCSKP
jgi:hypothetical protein